VNYESSYEPQGACVSGQSSRLAEMSVYLLVHVHMSYHMHRKTKILFFLKTATLEYRCDSEEQQTADKFPALQVRTVLVTGIDTQGSRIKGSRAENMETLDDRRE